MRRSVMTALATAAGALAALASPAISPAAAHAIIDLDGVRAVAGETSGMTLEIQHGCLPDNPTLVVEAFVGKPWRMVSPQPVAGWTSTVRRQPIGGWHITWTVTGEAIPFGTPAYFPITVAWPAKPGTYDMSVMQLCPESSYYWNTTPGPATADRPSPPLTPRPEVKVMAGPVDGK